MRFLRFNSDKIWFFGSFLLFLIAFAYLVKGFYHLMLDPNNPVDLVLRWKEQQYIYRGVYSYDVTIDSPNFDPRIGEIASGGYPPWAFFTGLIFIPAISLKATRFYFAILNLISIVILAIFSYRIGIPYGKTKALFYLSATLAFGSNATTLLNGQYGIIINAFLIGMFWLIENPKNIWAGLLLGVAMLKPNISAFYFFVLLFRRRSKAILSFFLYIIGASLIVWIITKRDPIYMLNTLLRQSKHFADEGYSSISFLTHLGIDSTSATILLALVGLVAVTVIFYTYRNSSLLTLFAIASVIGRVSTYHRFYDNVMLIFFLLALLEMTFKNPHRLNILVLMLVGISLWLPGRTVELDNLGILVQFFQLLVWGFGLVYLLVQIKFYSRDESQKSS